MKIHKNVKDVSVNSTRHNHGINEKLPKTYNLFAIYGENNKCVSLILTGTRKDIYSELVNTFKLFAVRNKINFSVSKSFFSPFNQSYLFKQYGADLSYYKVYQNEDLYNASCVARISCENQSISFVVVPFYESHDNNLR